MWVAKGKGDSPKVHVSPQGEQGDKVARCCVRFIFRIYSILLKGTYVALKYKKLYISKCHTL